MMEVVTFQSTLLIRIYWCLLLAYKSFLDIYETLNVYVGFMSWPPFTRQLPQGCDGDISMCTICYRLNQTPDQNKQKKKILCKYLLKYKNIISMQINHFKISTGFDNTYMTCFMLKCSISCISFHTNLLLRPVFNNNRASRISSVIRNMPMFGARWMGESGSGG